jgi:hypothetical protein
MHEDQSESHPGRNRKRIETVSIKSWTELIDELYRDSWDRDIGRFRSPYVFRGMANVANDLSTTLIRLGGRKTGLAKLEGHLLRNFRKYAHSDAAAGDSVWNWLALAAHHSLPTRLLDWTYSPFVALHFATENLLHYDKDAVIWCVNHRETLRKLPDELRVAADCQGSNIFTVEMLSTVADTLEKLQSLSPDDFLVFLEPPSLNPRIVNQFAVFSLMSTPDESMEAWLERFPDLSRKLVVPAQLKWEIRDKLDQAGITERTLFPGLDGLTAWLTRYYTPHETFKVEVNRDRSTVEQLHRE